MDIVAHIRQLLYLHDCVIVPGFGGFVANYRPAEIQFAQNSFSPPSKSIGFNRKLSGNDGLLIGYVSERNNLGYTDAARVVSDFVNTVKGRLDKGKAYLFEDIGSFQFDRHRNLQFEPAETLNFLIDSYGLARFTAVPLEPYDVRKRIRKFRDQAPAERKKTGKTLRRVLIALPILVALALVPLKTNYLDTLSFDFSSLNPLKKKEVQPAASPAESKASIGYESALEESGEVKPPAEQATPEPKLPESASPASTAHYYLIAGSFRSESNALSLLSELRSEGFYASVLPVQNGLYRVAMASFTDVGQALEELNSIRMQPGRKAVWLLRK